MNRLESERIVTQAPMSWAGSAARCKRLYWRAGDSTPLKILLGILAFGILLPVWWVVILAWYVVFGIILIPYRVMRRGQRRRKVEEARHRETLAHRAP